MDIKISPSMLASDFANLESELKKCETGGADLIHLDVMDGHFVPNISIGIPVIAAMKTVTISKKSTTSKTVSKLKSKKKYYVRIRAYKKSSGKKIYGAWSKTKTVKVK